MSFFILRAKNGWMSRGYLLIRQDHNSWAVEPAKELDLMHYRPYPIRYVGSENTPKQYHTENPNDFLNEDLCISNALGTDFKWTGRVEEVRELEDPLGRSISEPTEFNGFRRPHQYGHPTTKESGHFIALMNGKPLWLLATHTAPGMPPHWTIMCPAKRGFTQATVIAAIDADGTERKCDDFDARDLINRRLIFSESGKREHMRITVDKIAHCEQFMEPFP